MVLALITAFLVSSCDDGSPYALYDESGYQISVKYDANGGTFTTGTNVIVDTYGLNSLPLKNGKRVAKLVEPDDLAVRGAGKTFIPSKRGYTFAGWYTKRTEVKNANGTITYSYENKWDFAKDRLYLDPSKEYTAKEPVLTLYAAWTPEFKFEFYSLDNPDVLLGEYEVSAGGEITMPAWNEKNGEIKMYNFPKISGKTFEAVYTDPQGTNKLSGNTIKHIGTLNEVDATAVNPIMKLYIETIDGEWKHIFTAKQLGDIALDGNYVIENDIDFKGVDILGNVKYDSWGSHLISGKFTGKLIGKTKENGEPVKVKNLKFTQLSGADILSIGMFGRIEEGAVIENIAFEDVIMEMDTGAPMRSGVTFGLLAGNIASEATINNVSISGAIKISSECSFKGDNYSIGRVCGAGDAHGIDYSNIVCEAVGNNPERVTINIDGNTVTVDIQKVNK